jgi:hypothetical protein
VHRPIQLTNSTSSRRTSPVSRPDDTKAIETRFPTLIAHVETYPEGFLPSFRPAVEKQESTVNELKSVVAKQQDP